MAYITAEEMKRELDANPKYRDRLYCRGFLITDQKQSDLLEYPYYGNWNEASFTSSEKTYHFYTHKYVDLFTYEENGILFFLIGHAYNPYTMKYLESDILKDLAAAYKKSEEAFWEAESELTGVFCLGFIENGKVTVTTDCAGMQLIYHGVIQQHVYFTSHSKLVADFFGLEQTDYIKRLVSNRFWHYWGMWLPGDLSPYAELVRLQPNCKAVYDANNVTVTRYYPTHKIEETTTEEEYQKTIDELGRIMSNNMTLIAKKWPDKKVSISVTGGRDSMTTLACTNGNYDKYSYFSYISNNEESVDAYAARDILGALGLKHELYQIPDEWEGYQDIDIFKKIMECNAGCIGKNNWNDVKKRLYFCSNPPCDIEVKSWVNEIGRGRCYERFNKKSFPKNTTPSYWRTLHKVYFHQISLMKDTDKVFKEYFDKYYSNGEFEKIFWLIYYYWEFSWGGGEGIFLTAEHRVSYEITIPFNNRKYVELMLTVPESKRITDEIPKDLVAHMNHQITDTQIIVKDVAHTNKRALMERVHLEIFSRLRFVKY